MIQRIQSLFLFIAAGCFGGEFATAFASSSNTVAGLFADQKYTIMDHPALIVLTSLGALISLIAIFMFKHRSNQLKMTYLAATIAIILPIIAVLIYSNQTSTLGNVEIYDDAGLYLPIGMLVFSLLAAHFIRKDDKLVKSMDRLR